MSEQPIAVHLSDDLIFASRVSGEARAQGLTVKTARSLETLQSLAADAACVIIDLHFSGLDVNKLVTSMKAGRPMHIVGYGSHVDAERLKAAREAGCDLVLPRSAFVERLPLDLAEWLNTVRSDRL